MMFSDEEIKEIPETGFMRPGDEIISIKEVCLNDKFYKKDSTFNSEPLLSNNTRNDLDTRSIYRDGFYPDGSEQQQAQFAWTEEDIADLVSQPGFGTTGQTTFGRDFDAALKTDLKEADTSSSVFQPRLTFNKKIFTKENLVSSTSRNSTPGPSGDRSKVNNTCKVDKADPRSRYHFVKYVKRHGRTVKLWECGICSREFQHQYTLMRHLPTHTDERNFHCGTCGKSFRQLSTLSQHRAIHSAERPYACEMCNKTFNRVSTLISHRKTHNFEKPYKCHICPKGFHQKGNLRNHLFTHTNERPYRCNICFKGFNQQSNLVCHKNKVHSDNADSSSVACGRSIAIIHSSSEIQPDSTRPQAEQCEVSSTVGPYLPSAEEPSSSDWAIKPEEWVKYPNWSVNGVIVDPIKTYHMGVALATRQTPFALLKPHNGTPVLVKVVDTNLPGGKQMLVPATAEDFRIGSQIVIKNEPVESSSTSKIQDTQNLEANDAVQIKVPVVATVVSKIKPGGRLQLTVEEPHRAYHTALPSNGEVVIQPCIPKVENDHRIPVNALQRPEMQRLDTCNVFEERLRTGTIISSTCALPPPAPSPPLDFTSMDLFESMECIPLGPQITAVDIDQPPPSDDSDIFIGEFEESIPLSDSD